VSPQLDKWTLVTPQELLREAMYNELLFYFSSTLVEGAYRHHSEGLWAAWRGTNAEHERGRGEKANMSLNGPVHAMQSQQVCAFHRQCSRYMRTLDDKITRYGPSLTYHLRR